MKKILFLLALVMASAAHAQTAPTNYPGGVYLATPPTLADKQTGTLQMDANGNLKVVTTGSGGTQDVNITEVGGNAVTTSLPIQGLGTAGTPAGGVLTVQGDPSGEPIPISGSFSSTTEAVATAAAPSYSEGTTNPLSMDLSGGIRVTGTFSATTSAVATAADPSYSEGVAEAFSQDLSGHLRVILGANSGVDVGDVTVNNGSGGSAVNIQDGGNTITVDNGGTFAVQAAQSGTWNINNVSGTVSLPTGAATAAKQPALGTAGTASSDVITVQGIASMTPLLVDGTGGSFPVSGTVTANQGGSWSVTATQGTAANLNATVVGTGTFAVQAAQSGTWTVQPGNTANTTPWVVTGSGTAGSAATGVLSIQGIASMTPVYTSLRDLAGNAVSAGNGASGTGTLRVTVANDSTGVLASIGSITTSVVPGTGATNLGKAEDAAHSSGDTGVMSLAVRNDTPTALATTTGDYIPPTTDSLGKLWVAGSGLTGSAVPGTAAYLGANTGGNLTGLVACNSTAKYDASTSGSTELVALASSQTIRVCGFNIIAGGTVNVKLVYGTGTNCGTGSTNMTPAYQLTAQAGMVDHTPFWNGLATAASNALCINASGATAVQAMVYYTQY